MIANTCVISYVKQFNVKHHHYLCCCRKFTLFEYYRVGIFHNLFQYPNSQSLPIVMSSSTTHTHTHKNKTLIKFDYFSKINNSNTSPKAQSLLWQYGFLNVLSSFITCVITQSLCLSAIIL